MEHMFIRTSQGHLHGVKQVREGAPALLLLHSNGGAWRQFAATFAGFSSRYSVYALDLPGQGDSYPLPDYYSIERYSDVILEAVDALGLQRTTVLGCSVGGSVAIDLAARHPERFEQLVIVETPARTEQAWASRWAPMEALFGVLQQSFDAAAKRVVGLTPEAYMEWNIDRHKAGAGTMVSVMWAMRLYDTLGAIDRVRQPALVIFGEGTPIADSRGVYENRLARAPLVTLPACGHFPMMENPQALVAAVLEWGASHGR